MKIYGFKFDRVIAKQQWSQLINHNFPTSKEIYWFDDEHCFFHSEININQTLNELLPLMENDLSCQITALITHDCDNLSKKALDLAAKYQKGKLLSIADVCLLAVLKNETDFMKIFEDYFNHLDAELLHTNEVFLANNFSGTVSAQLLYIHRNTLLYRRDKFQQLTKLNLRDFDDASLFKFWLTTISPLKLNT